jgi:hypothetical protein
MDYEIHIVKQHPVGLVITLDVRRPQAFPRESLLYLIRDGLNLPRVATAANDEKVGKAAGGFVEFEQSDIGGLLGFTGVQHVQEPDPCFAW